MAFFIPLIPAVIAAGAFVAGAVVAGDNSEAQVIVNTAEPSTKTSLLTKTVIAGGLGLAAVYIVPKVLGK